jgi:chemotaxis family two-component system response regulator Rcp1
LPATDTATLLHPGAVELWEAEVEASTPLFPLSMSIPVRPKRSGKAVDVLLVEDNPADVRLTREIFEDGDRFHLSVVGDGEEAMAFIRREGVYSECPRPSLVLLDLNLPKKDGREVLQELKTDPELRCIPVVVLTTSGAESDIVRSYELYANCFITKPLDVDEFFSALRSIKDFWLASARLPS